MIKVCHMTSAHDPEDVRIFHKECVSLANAGYDTYLVQAGENYEKMGVHLVGFGVPGKNRFDRMLNVSRRAYEAALAVDAQIYHLHDPELMPYGLKLKKKGKKVIFDCHESYAMQIRNKQYLPKWSRNLVAFLYRRYEKYVLGKLDGLVFPCLVNGKNPYKGDCRNMAIVDNVPRLEELYDQYDPSIEKYPHSICQLGSLTHNRGITHLVKAACAADCTAYIAGSFETEDYEMRIRGLPEFDHVQYLGILNRSQVLQTLQRCQIGMATLLNVGQYSQDWNLSTKVYEHMALALPTVMSDTPYNRMVVEKYGIGICVDPENITQIAHAIRWLLDNPEKAKQMGENGRRAAKEVFNWRVEEKKLLALYETIAKE